MKALILRTGYDPDAGAPASRSPLARPQTVAPVPSCLRLVCPLSAPPRSSPGCASRGPAEGPPYELAKARVFELLGVRWAWDEGPNPPELPTITLCPFPAAPRRTRVERRSVLDLTQARHRGCFSRFSSRTPLSGAELTAHPRASRRWRFCCARTFSSS